jgi:hypothetical protein
MKITRRNDIILNVFFPLLLGYFIYSIANTGAISLLIKNYLPDGLWAYSFISLILIIWNRRFNFLWIFTSFLLAASFEVFQYFHFIPGTADGMDILVYFIFISSGLLANHYFRKIVL